MWLLLSITFLFTLTANAQPRPSSSSTNSPLIYLGVAGQAVDYYHAGEQLYEIGAVVSVRDTADLINGSLVGTAVINDRFTADDAGTLRSYVLNAEIGFEIPVIKELWFQPSIEGGIDNYKYAGCFCDREPPLRTRLQLGTKFSMNLMLRRSAWLQLGFGLLAKENVSPIDNPMTTVNLRLLFKL